MCYLGKQRKEDSQQAGPSKPTDVLSECSDDSVADKNYCPDASESSDDDDVHVFKTVSILKTSKRPRNKNPCAAAQNDVAMENSRRNAAEKGAYSRKKRSERKEKRNTGKSYITAKNKVVKERVSKPLTSCRMKCSQKLEVKFDEERTIREKIFQEYWALGDRNKRVRFIAGLVDTKEPASSRKRTLDPDKEKFRTKTHIFHFVINGERVRVCRACFMKTLGETQMFVTLSLCNKNSTLSGITYDDNRGRSISANKHSNETLQQVKDHISSFPLYQSHYTRRESSRRYLPPHLSLSLMYNLYCDQINSTQRKPVSRQIYEREFHKMNLSFKEPKVDTCNKCDLLRMKIRVAGDEEEKKKSEEELAIHHIEADNAYEEKRKDKELAANDQTRLCFMFDLQQCLPTPMLNTSVAFYKRQLWTFNLTLHETSTQNVRCYMWHEAEGGRGGNQIATCIFKELTSLPSQVSKVTLYSDTCGGQNKNSHVATMFLVAMQQNTHLEIVDHKFLISGHTHLECDVDHGLIEKQKKKLQVPISHPYDWYQLVRSVGKKKKFEVIELNHSDFLNFADLLKKSLQLRKKDVEGNQFNWHSVKWFRYTRESGKILYKTTLDNDEPFHTLCLNRRGQPDSRLHPERLYKSSLPISKEKKKDILDLLPLISPTFHDFYRNLKSSDMPDTYPDSEDDDLSDQLQQI